MLRSDERQRVDPTTLDSLALVATSHAAATSLVR